MKIIVIRHGETEDNQRGAIYGASNQGLSDVGRKQSHRAALLLKAEPLDIIYCSDLQRCVETAEIIRVPHPSVSITYTPLLREIGGGRIQHLPLRLPSRLLDLLVWLVLRLNLAVPGSESWRDLKVRIRSALNEFYRLHPDATILLVTHNVAIQAIHSLLETSGDKKFTRKSISNCGIMHFTMSKPLS